MMNPDGVIAGNYRTSLSGKDLNRQFSETNEIIFPTVYSLKKLIKTMKKKYHVLYDILYLFSISY